MGPLHMERAKYIEKAFTEELRDAIVILGLLLTIIIVGVIIGKLLKSMKNSKSSIINHTFAKVIYKKWVKKY